jgi:hypothetical protein
VSPTDVPIDWDREEAARAAAAELAKPEYRQDDDPWPLRVWRWLLETFDELLSDLIGVTPGGPFGLIVLVGLLVLAVVAIRLGFGPFARSSAVEQQLFVGRLRTADEHRRTADDAALRGDWDTAVAERYRAIVRGLEERGLLEPRAGRTADEAAREAGIALPEVDAELSTAARTFDDVRYGGRHAYAGVDRRLRDLDDRVRLARPVAHR